MRAAIDYGSKVLFNKQPNVTKITEPSLPPPGTRDDKSAATIMVGSQPENKIFRDKVTDTKEDPDVCDIGGEGDDEHLARLMRNTWAGLSRAEKREIQDRTELSVMNAVTAAWASFGTLPMQNVIANGNTVISLYKQSGMGGFLAGGLAFTGRQAISSGFGFSGTDAIVDGCLASLPLWLRPVFAGIIVGTIEGQLTFAAERKEVGGMLHIPPAQINRLMLQSLATLRNGFGWIGGGIAMKYTDMAGLKPDESFLLGFTLGTVAGMSSMPLQNAVYHGAKTNATLRQELTHMADRSLRDSFRGAFTRALMIGCYTAVAAATSSWVESRRKGDPVSSSVSNPSAEKIASTQQTSPGVDH
jgi:hypothetical protein